MSGRDEQIEAFLDGPAGREPPPELRLDVELQRQVDASLRRLAAPPDLDALLARARAEAARPPASSGAASAPARSPRVSRRTLVGLGIAGGLGALVVWRERSKRPTPHINVLAQEYDRQVQAGLAPEVPYVDAPTLAAELLERLGHAVTLAATGPGVVLLGLSAESLHAEGETVELLATADGAPVVVFFDRVKVEHEGCLGSRWTRRGVRVHVKDLGPVRAYELSTLPAPRILPGLA